jgi:hypothetical protein
MAENISTLSLRVPSEFFGINNQAIARSNCDLRIAGVAVAFSMHIMFKVLESNIKKLEVLVNLNFFSFLVLFGAQSSSKPSMLKQVTDSLTLIANFAM